DFPDHLLPPAPSSSRGGDAIAAMREPVPVPVAADPLPAVDPFADDGLLPGLGERGERELDPLRLLDYTPELEPGPGAGGWNHTPSATDHFQPQRPAAAPAQLPERWDLTTGEWAGPPAAGASPPSPPSPPSPSPSPSSSPPPPMFSPPSI